MTPFNNHLIIIKILIILYHSWLLLCKYPVQPVCTFFLHIPAYFIIIIKSTVYYSAHYFILFYFLFIFLLFIFYFTFFPCLYLCIFSCVYISYNCTVHGADLTYISLLIIFCIIVYVTKKILNLELWSLESFSHSNSPSHRALGR